MRCHDVRISLGDGAALVRRLPDDAFCYLDPPYYASGSVYGSLYSRRLHEDLARALRHRQRWVLAYDTHDGVRAMYEPWARVESVSTTHTFTYGAHQAEEFVISPHVEPARLTRSEETKLGMARAKAAGRSVGRPRAIAKPSRVRALRARGWSWSKIAARLGASATSCRRAALR
jgi:hypothetical protein